jgi:hypothetical protein
MHRIPRAFFIKKFIMAKDKKSFILYADQKALFEKLPDDLAGKLIKHIFKYVNDENPVSEDLIIEIAFEPIKNHLKRDLKLFEEKLMKRSEAGKAGAEKRWQEMANDGKRINNIANDGKRIKPIAKIAENVNVNDNDIHNTPPLEDFIAFAVSKVHNIDTDQVRLKYESWLVNDWSTNSKGKKTKIKNWKSTLLNTLPYISRIDTNEPKELQMARAQGLC